MDVSAAPFVLNGSQTLYSSGTNNGSVSTSPGAKIYAGTDGTYGTNTFNNNLTLGVGSSAYFDLGTNFNGTNDLINVGGLLSLNGNNIHIKAPNTSSALYSNADYVLFNAAGGINGSCASQPVFDVAPPNASRFVVITDKVNKQVRLHAFPVGWINPTAVGTATPTTVYGLQTALISVTVTPGTTNGVTVPISSVVLDASSYGGTSSVTLVQSNSSSVYTNTIIIPNNPNTGTFALSATVTDTANMTGVASILLNINPGFFWTGLAGDNNWSSPGNWLGNSAPTTTSNILTFAGTTRLTPNMEQAYINNGITFDPTAGAFTLGSASSSTLALNGSVTNNSPFVQTFNMAMTISGSQNFSTAATNIILNGAIADGASPGTLVKVGTNTLTLTNNNASLSGGITLPNSTSGTIALMGDYSGGGGVISLAGGSTMVVGSANAVASAPLNLRGNSNVKLKADATTMFAVGTPATGSQVTAPSASGSINFDVSPLTSASGATLTLNAPILFSSSADQTINVTGSNTYTLGLGAISLTSATSHTPYLNLYINTLPGGPGVVINAITTGNWGADVDMNGGGSVTILGNFSNTSNGNGNLFVNNGTTVTLQGQTIKANTGDAYKYDVVNGTLVLDDDGALINNTSGAGLTQSLFVLGAITNVISGASTTFTHSAGVLTTTNNSFNAAVYLGDASNLTGGLYVDATVTNNVSDGDVGFTNSGTFIIGGQNTSGINSYYNPIILGWTPNRGKSVTLVAKTGGEVDFGGGILANGTNLTAGVTIGNGPTFAGLVNFTGGNSYGGPTIINNGKLELTAANALSNSTPINVGVGTTFDVTGVSGFTLGAAGRAQTLSGNGTVNGPVTVSAGSTLAPGNPLGTLTINGNVTLGGNVAMNLNRTNSPINSSQLRVTGGTITAGGTLNVTNIGPALQVNDSFQLFTAGVSGFTTVNLATNDANNMVYTWQNNLASSGSIRVLSAVPLINTNAATANFKAVVAGGSLSFTWAPDHLGWQLYTNAVGLNASGSWFPVPGSAAVTNETIPVNAGNSKVFFQLRYP